MMNKKQCISALLLLCTSASVFATDGIVLGATRVIYNGDSKEASVTVDNRSDKQYFLIQSWVDDAKGNKNVPFVVTPPLFRLNASKENMLRVIKKEGDIPADRESVYWVNVKAIPPAPEAGQGQNVLQLAIKTRVKLFYRPAGLPGTAMDAPATLQWSMQGNELVAKNPSAYSVTLNTLKVDGKEIKDVNLVMPKSETHYPLTAGAGHSVSFDTINDYGGISPLITAKVN